MCDSDESILRQINLKMDELKKKYKNDEDAMEEIERHIETVKYYEEKGNLQQAKSATVHLEAFLHDWYPV